MGGGGERSKKLENGGCILTDVICCCEEPALEAFRGEALPKGRREATHVAQETALCDVEAHSVTREP